MQKVIFVCGPDRCGKTEISKEISKRTGVPYFKASSEHNSFLTSRVSKNDLFLNQLRFADPRVFDLLKQTGHSTVFDRGFPCEYSYSSVFGRETDIDMIHKMDEMWASLGARIIFCHRSSYTGISDDLDPSVNSEVLQRIHNAYLDFLSWTKCNSLCLNVDDENLDREMQDIARWLSI